MRVADLMRTDVVTLREDELVRDAIERLVDAHVTGVPVVDQHGRMLGVLSATDILTALAERRTEAERNLLLDDTVVRDLMTPRPETIEPDADIREAAQRLLYLGIHRLFVEREGRVVGVVSQGDLVQAMATARML